MVEPLLKVLFLMTQSKPSESDIDSGDIETMKDLTKVMRDFIGKEQTNMNIIKLGVLNILQLKQFFPADGELIVGNVLKELISSQQTLMKTQFEAKSFDTDQLSSLIVNCKKFNQMMSSISIAQLLDREMIKNWCNYTSKKTFEMLK